jgi:hypothetical protein
MTDIWVTDFRVRVMSIGDTDARVMNIRVNCIRVRIFVWCTGYKYLGRGLIWVIDIRVGGIRVMNIRVGGMYLGEVLLIGMEGDKCHRNKDIILVIVLLYYQLKIDNMNNSYHINKNKIITKLK